MKRIRINLFRKIWYGKEICWKCFFVLFFTISAVIIGLVGSSGIQISLLLSFIIVPTSSLIVCILYTIFKVKLSHIPDLFDDEGLTEGPYLCKFATKKDLAEACKLTRPYYGAEYVAPEIAEQWRVKDEKGFMVIFNKDSELCASFGIIALKEHLMKSFIEGKIEDTKITADDIYTFKESKKKKELYISGVIVCDPNSLVCKRNAQMMFWAMLRYVKKYYSLKMERDYYALAVNKQSKNILKKLGAVLISNKKREDGCDLYKITLNSHKWEEISKKVGDFSKMCTMKFE